MAVRTIKSLEMGLTGAPAAGHSPALGSQAAPPGAAAASEAGGLRAPSCGCSGDAGAQPPAFGERLVLYEVLGMLEMVPLS